MGGGDLNLKKSWHPSTLRNIERVWKAEQKHEVEKQKIEQLQKELAEERAREEIQTFAEDQGVVRKKDERLDWMYQGPAAAMVNREEYLLGRKIDKTLENLQLIEKGVDPSQEEESDVTCSVFSSQNLTGTATVDLATKIREDPLFTIMKKEKDERKNLLTNPVKMKQLQQLLEASLGNSKSKKSKKNKKKKHDDSDEEKQEKRRRKHKKNYSSESDDQEISKALSKNQQSRKEKMFNSNYNSSERRSSRYEYDEPNSNERGNKTSYPSPDDGECDYRSSHPKNSQSTSDYRDTRYDHYQERMSSKDHYSSKKRSSKYEYNEHNSNEKRQKNVYVSSDGREFGHRSTESKNSYSSSEYIELRHQSSQRSEHSSHKSHHSKQHNSKPYSRQEPDTNKADKKRKLDASERERLLKEMQENAKWREDQRKRNTQRYKEEEEKEDTVERVDPSHFLKPMLSKAAGKGSLENRVKQKIFSIQRNSAAMDKNFARRD